MQRILSTRSMAKLPFNHTNNPNPTCVGCNMSLATRSHHWTKDVTPKKYENGFFRICDVKVVCTVIGVASHDMTLPVIITLDNGIDVPHIVSQQPVHFCRGNTTAYFEVLLFWNNVEPGCRMKLNMTEADGLLTLEMDATVSDLVDSQFI